MFSLFILSRVIFFKGKGELGSLYFNRRNINQFQVYVLFKVFENYFIYYVVLIVNCVFIQLRIRSFIKLCVLGIRIIVWNFIIIKVE